MSGVRRRRASTGRFGGGTRTRATRATAKKAAAKREGSRFFLRAPSFIVLLVMRQGLFFCAFSHFRA